MDWSGVDYGKLLGIIHGTFFKLKFNVRHGLKVVILQTKTLIIKASDDWVKSAAQIWCNCHKCWMTNESRNRCKHRKREDPASFQATDWTKSTCWTMPWDEKLLFQRCSDLRAALNEKLCESGQCDITILRSDAPRHHRPQSRSQTSSNHTDGERWQNTCISCLHGRDSCSSP